MDIIYSDIFKSIVRLSNLCSTYRNTASGLCSKDCPLLLKGTECTLLRTNPAHWTVPDVILQEIAKDEGNIC